jgi:predicted NBD/HSP70 family sugar kinase
MTNYGPVRHRTIREFNLAEVLGQVALHQPVTRARLAELTGFTKTTVSNLLAVLAEAGMVRDGAQVHEGERGRPGVAVMIDGNGGGALGLEINVDYLAACVLDLDRRVRYRHTVAADNRGRAPEEVIDSLSELAGHALDAAAGQGLRVAGAAVALPGLLGHDRDLLRQAPRLGWTAVPVGNLLRTALPPLLLSTCHDNEANLAALGELWFGAGTALGDFVYVSGEIGIGAGIVVDGRLFRGSHGFAGELGHLVVAPDGPRCGCGGHGCLEELAGQRALLRAAGLEEPGSVNASATALVRLLEAGDEQARQAMETAGTALAAALASAVNLLDPDTIVLGGMFSPLAPWIQSPVENALATGSGTLQMGPPPVVMVSKLGAEAAVLGAAGLIIEHVIASPALLIEPDPATPLAAPRRR